MSKDIRSFFKPISKSSISQKAATKKKVNVIVSSDEDENIIEASPELARKKASSSKLKRSKTTSPTKKEALKPVDAANLFSKTPIRQTKSAANIQEDERRKKREEAFNKTLEELDNMDMDMADLNKTIDEAVLTANHQEVVSTPRESRKRKAEKELSEAGLDPDQERYEKRRQSAAMYQQYLNRERPPNEGQKEYPKGKPDCLKGLCFLKTGVLDSLDSEALNQLVKQFGGRTVGTVSKKVDFLIIGDQPGPSKLEKARNYRIKEISEDELLDMILIKSGDPPRYCKKSLEPEGTKEAGVKTEEKKDIPAKGKQQPNLKKSPKEATISSPNKTPTSKPSASTSKPLPIKQVEVPAFKVDKVEVGENCKAWTEKYKPTDIKSIIGQQDSNSNMKKLLNWLQKWSQNHLGLNKVDLKKPSPFARNDDGAYFKCALLSGPPGVGKTTTASLVAKELGFDVVEFNASDTRNKKLLHEQVAQLLSSKSIATYFKDGKAPTLKHVLLMDEVDGMSGNQDRGGVQELIALIKKTSIPIICMCNDRQHPKIRSLVNYCFDLRFGRIKPESIVGPMMSICFKEGLNMPKSALMQIITATGMDIRQILNQLSIFAASKKNVSDEVVEQEKSSLQKDVVMGPWEVVRKVFSATDNASMSVAEKTKLFYYDYNIGPLFIQENYLSVEPSCDKKDTLKHLALAADAISMGDVISTSIRSTNNWSLMEAQAIHSSVMPGFYMQGQFRSMINFPGWLGKNSKRNKFQRMLCELQSHLKAKTSASRAAVNLDYIYHLPNKILKPLKTGTPGVSESVSTMLNYSLLREDLDNMLELAQWPKSSDPMKSIESKVKSAFTREYNKRAVLSYSLNTTIKKTKSTSKDNEEDYAIGDEMEAEGIASEEENDDDITKDVMIKTKKKPEGKPKKAEGATPKKASARGGTSSKKEKKSK